MLPRKKVASKHTRVQQFGVCNATPCSQIESTEVQIEKTASALIFDADIFSISRLFSDGSNIRHGAHLRKMSGSCKPCVQRMPAGSGQYD